MFGIWLGFNPAPLGAGRALILQYTSRRYRFSDRSDCT